MRPLTCAIALLRCGFGLCVTLIVVTIGYIEFFFHKSTPCGIYYQNMDDIPPITFSTSASQHLSNDSIDCLKLLSGDEKHIDYVRQWEGKNGCRYLDEEIEDEYMFMGFDTCLDLLKVLEYQRFPVTQEEVEFPLAFAISTYENTVQSAKLLINIHRDHNFYCIHVDKKATKLLREIMKALSGCLKNVVILDVALDVHWGEISVLDAFLHCVRKLLEMDKTWKYFVNLSGREFPLRTNLELVRIFKSYNGGNDIVGEAKEEIPYYTDVVHKGLRRTLYSKDPPPHGFVISKGPMTIAATREFMNFSVNDPKAIDLHNWMKDVYIPDELFFNTLVTNPQLGVPGAHQQTIPGQSGQNLTGSKYHQYWTVIRYKIWKGGNYDLEPGAECTGGIIRWICNLGAGDIHHVVKSRGLFVNKFRHEYHPVGFRCIELWYRNRTIHEPNSDFEVEFYASQAWARKPT